MNLPPALTHPSVWFVWEAVHDRYAREALGTPVRSVTFTALTDAQRAALAGLLERGRLPGPTFTLRLEELDRRLLASDAVMTARQVAEVICGPIRNQPEAKRAARDTRQQMWARLEQAAGDRLAGWIQHLRTSGTATKAARAAHRPVEDLVAEAVSVAQRLPAQDGVQLGALARQASGYPHALDRGQPLRTLVLLAALHLTGEPLKLPSSLVAQRTILAAVGIYADSVSTDVLVLGLRATGTGHVDRLLNEASDAGEPLRLTLRMLHRASPTLKATDRPLSVCENPSIVEAAAAQLDPDAAPLVCTDGVPSAAVLGLLDAARQQGAKLRVSADFDVGGIRITNLLAGRYTATSWRYTAAVYRQAIAAQQDHHRMPLPQHIPDSHLDPQLATALRGHRIAVFEEQQTDLLLNDLRAC